MKYYLDRLTFYYDNPENVIDDYVMDDFGNAVVLSDEQCEAMAEFSISYWPFYKLSEY